MIFVHCERQKHETHTDAQENQERHSDQHEAQNEGDHASDGRVEQEGGLGAVVLDRVAVHLDQVDDVSLARLGQAIQRQLHRLFEDRVDEAIARNQNFIKNCVVEQTHHRRFQSLDCQKSNEEAGQEGHVERVSGSLRGPDQHLREEVNDENVHHVQEVVQDRQHHHHRFERKHLEDDPHNVGVVALETFEFGQSVIYSQIRVNFPVIFLFEGLFERTLNKRSQPREENL